MAIVIWIFFSFIVAVAAANLDRSFFGWFLLSMIFSPLICVIFLAISGRNVAIHLSNKENVGPFADNGNQGESYPGNPPIDTDFESNHLLGHEFMNDLCINCGRGRLGVESVQDTCTRA